MMNVFSHICTAIAYFYNKWVTKVHHKGQCKETLPALVRIDYKLTYRLEEVTSFCGMGSFSWLVSYSFLYRILSIVKLCRLRIMWLALSMVLISESQATKGAVRGADWFQFTHPAIVILMVQRILFKKNPNKQTKSKPHNNVAKATVFLSTHPSGQGSWWDCNFTSCGYVSAHHVTQLD